MSDAPARPRPVTWSAAVISVGSVLVLITSWQVVAGIGSLETREGMEEFLAEPPGSGLGLGVDGALEALRITAMVGAACAVAAAILGWQVLQRSTSARIALSLLAAPLFLAGTATGGLVSAAVVAGIITLWLSPAREWFAGREPAARPARGAGPTASGTDAPPAQPGPHQPGPQQPAPPVQGTPQPAAPYAHAAGAGRGPRPPALLVACLVTWSLCGLTLLLAGSTAAVLWAVPDVVLDAVREQDPSALEPGVSANDLQIASTVLIGVLLVWCVGACVAAALALRGRVGARITLLVSAAVTAVVCFAATLASLIFAVPLVGGLVVISLLARADVRAWR